MSSTILTTCGGVNRHGLKDNALWEMGVTHYSSFGKQKYLHVTVDTYSVFIMATPSMGEECPQGFGPRLIMCVYFKIMDLPRSIKTDNGPTYTFKGFDDFCSKFAIHHV